jgi:diguanylate cyclase (GGDEF)-like protein
MIGENILPNKEILDSLLENELKRSLRYQNFTSILLFEAQSTSSKVRDQNHSDIAERMAALIRSEIRETDIVGMYSGNTVIVVLLYSDKNIAIKVGDRLSKWISNYFSSSGKSSQTLSVGGACFPSHATDSRSLYQKAFEMVESAKARGDNCVQILD